MKKLHLNLIRKWFDLIAKNEKKEEYREITPYWIGRLIWYHRGKKDPTYKEFVEDVIANPETIDSRYLNLQLAEFAVFSDIVFSNGYSKTRDQMVYRGGAVTIKKGKKEWGAEPGKYYFVIPVKKFVYGYQIG